MQKERGRLFHECTQLYESYEWSQLDRWKISIEDVAAISQEWRRQKTEQL